MQPWDDDCDFWPIETEEDARKYIEHIQEKHEQDQA
jgi:hypothetical protein